MFNGNNKSAALVASGIVCALLLQQTAFQSAQAQQSIILILDHEGQAAGQLEILCDNSSGGEQCGNNQDVVIRYHASAGRDLELREDLDCPSCLSGPAKFQGPTGTDYVCTDLEYPVLIPAGSTLDISAESCGVELPLPAGPWAFLSDVLGLSQPVVAFFDVSFFVLPESPIGAVALMGSSLAVLGGFLYYRQNRGSASL
jgi:hypothetical protein